MPISKLFSCLQFRLEDNIYKLDYSNNILSDCFPNVWKHERTLEELDITSARINYLPPQLFYCHELKVLLASNNNIETIPEGVGALCMLQKLSLNKNFISNVPDNIKCCKNLTHLDLSCNNLQKIPDAITYLISLQEIFLNESYLEFLPANFGRLVNLRIIELRSNNLVSLPKSMHRLKNLIRLDIGCNEFTVLPEVIGELKQLRELWFDSNRINYFPPYLEKLRELIHCDANGNCFNNIPNELGGCRNLELFSVSSNSLKKLFRSVGLLKSLVTFKCEDNVLTDLPDSISMLESLEELDVRHNKLESLPNAIGLLRKLQYFFADDNNLRNIPNEICSCSALSILSISRNKLSELPSNLGHLQNLKVLNVVENNISSLPVSVLNLVKLKSLWISHNQSKPLMPLQYTDISKKSELTCFMLPQSNTKYQSLFASHSTEKYDKTFCTKQDTVEEQSSNILTKRRICFAEHTTILNSNKEPFNTIATFNYNDINIYPAHKFYEANSVMSPDHDDELISIHRKNLLMRSPTPYPKALRSLEQTVQGHQNKNISVSKYNSNSINNIKNETPNINYNNELHQYKNDYKQNMISNKKDNLRGVLEMLQNIKHYQLDVGKIHDSKIMHKQMVVSQYNYNREKDEFYEKKHGEISEDSAKNICAKIHCLNPNLISRSNTKKSSNKWLFGVHKNPRVLQVQVVWQNGCDITVNFLPNREGIYVASTDPQSSASKVLFPFDKLLEVDGTDFTCISLDEARHLLDKPRPIINIMLSR